MSAKVREKRRRLRLPKRIQIDVGILEKGGDAEPGGLTVAEVANFHEFGLGVPQRSFIRGWFDTHKEQAIRFLVEAINAQDRGSGVTDAGLMKSAADRAAIKIRDSVKNWINSRPFKPLAPETIRRKGSDLPLVDTGILRSAITTRVKVE